MQTYQVAAACPDQGQGLAFSLMRVAVAACRVDIEVARLVLREAMLGMVMWVSVRIGEGGLLVCCEKHNTGPVRGVWCSVPFPTTPSVSHPYTVPHTSHWRWVHCSVLLNCGALRARGRGEEGAAHSHCVLGQYCSIGW